MGNTGSGALDTYLSRFTQDEQISINGLFDKLLHMEDGSSKDKKTVTATMLKGYLHEALPDSITIQLFNAMRNLDPSGKGSPASLHICKEQLIIFLSYILRGNAHEKAMLVLSMITGSKEQHVKGGQILEFTETLISSVLHLLKHRDLLKGWCLDGTRDNTEGVKLMAVYLTSELKPAGETVPMEKLLEAQYDLDTIDDFLYRVSIISTLLNLLVCQGLSIPMAYDESVSILPQCKDVNWVQLQSILDLPSVMYLNSQLPAEVQHQWRLLFSTKLHGESFSRLSGRIIRKGPTVVVVKDQNKHIFGGFASHSWEFKPQFQGNNRCMLFSIYPVLSVYTCTGYNDHFMYLNQGQKTMPNGLGMGGQHDYFGLWIDCDFGKGHSKAKPRCTTFNSPQLSAEEDFIIDTVEVWAVGEPPDESQIKTKSILDADPEAQALLEMVGKPQQSIGLREPEKEEEDGK
ncbi:MTOR-associated protein MEAK7 isoform X1 [Erpetoichthys calabaricus]|uniref:MTOR-associated protein MEAK7 n=2 Tax=Erpetoichthys calabaricus TaxID=27687 RepID=A0A8C4XAJ1_ERPCA|nr:MTOR-associated protein MEAK7 isoform X1 [Erpetoichthys calabaricus]